MSGQGVGVKMGAAWRALLAGIVVVGTLGPVMVAGPSAAARTPGVQLPRGSRDGSPVHVLRVSPADGTTEAPRATPVVVFFDRPMVPLLAVESAAPAAPAHVDPLTPGRGRWLNTATWAWYPAPALRGATRYTVTVPAGLRAVDGSRLAATYQATFSTPRPAVARVSPADGAAYADFRAPLTLRFNQSMDRASVAAGFALRDAAGRAVPGTLSWPRPDTLVFRPRTWLALGARYSAAVGAGIRSAEGPLPAHAGASWSFRTAGLPTVSDTTPSNGDCSADMTNGLILHFNAPVDPRLVRAHLLLVPRPARMSVDVARDGLTAYVYGAYLPSTHYHLALDGVLGTYGQAPPAPFRMGFITAPLAPAVQFAYGNPIVSFDAYRPIDVALRAVNTHGVTLTLYPLARTEFLTLLQNPSVLQTFTPAARAVFSVVRRAGSALNKTEGLGQELSAPGGGALRPGFYFLSATGADGGSDQIAFMVTRTALTFKSSADRTLVWATDLHSGRPLPGLLVRVVRASNGGLVAAGHTGPDGVLDTRYTRAVQPYDLVALLDRPGDASLCSATWGTGVSPGDYNLPNDVGVGGLPGHLGYLYTDRPIYRPGQPVRFRGLVRRDDDGAYGLPVRGTPVRVTLTDATGHVVYAAVAHLDAVGAFAGTVTPAPNAPLGQDILTAQVGSQTFSVTMQIAAYRKPDFTVAASSVLPDGNYTSGETVRVRVAARYLFGAPLNRARVHWSVVGTDLYFSPPAYPDYTFQDYPFIPFLPYAASPLRAARPPGYPAPAGGPTYGYGSGPAGDCVGCGPPAGANVVAQGDTRTDANGNLTLAIPAALRHTRLSQQWSLEADVSDVNNVSISGRTLVAVHKGLFYVGLRGPSALVVAGRPSRIDLLTLAQTGTRLVSHVPLVMKLYRRTYRMVNAPSPFGVMPQWLPVDTLIRSFPAATGADARGHVLLTLPSSGEFRIAAEAHDARGNLVRSAISLYAVGPQEAASPWPAPPQDRIRLVPDRALYHVGDVARVLVAAPRPGMTALVTIERGRVYSHRVLHLSGASPVLRIPVLPGYLPNVFVSVVVVSGTEGPHADVPLWKMGVVELPVDVRARQLRLTLRASATRTHPGAPLTIHLHAADQEGRPVRGAFSLAVVDEGVLLLAAEHAPAILDAFYAERGLGVQTAYSQNVAAFQVPTGGAASASGRERRAAQFAAAGPARPGGHGGGGAGGGGQFARLRARFPDTAYWNPTVVTDAHGDATVSFTLPDTLTTWRIAVRGLTADTLVGQASLDVVSTLDLLLRPVIPRFFTLDDSAQVGAVVNNTTDRALAARVTLSTGGSASSAFRLPPPALTAVVAAHGERLVTWPVRPAALGVERLELAVSAPGVVGDRVLAAAPVEPNSTPEVVATAGEVGTSRLERVVVPAAAQPGEGGLTLTLQPSLAAGLRSSVDYLRHEPFESNEDLAARLMGEVALARLPSAVTGLSAATLAAYRRDVVATIGRLLAAQRGDGGWGWWIGDPFSSPAITAFCLDALAMARRAGYPVLGGSLRAATGYVAAQAAAASTSPLAAPGGSGPVTPDLRAYMAYLLAGSGAGAALFPSRDSLPLWSRAYLLRALYRENGNRLGPRGRTVLAELEAGAHLDAAGAHWEDSGSLVSMDDPIHATAVVLDALLETDPASPLIAPATRWLMSARHGEVWQTTVDNAVALRALSDELRGSGELGGRYTYMAVLGDNVWGKGTVSPTTLAQPRVLTAPLRSQQSVAPGQSTLVRVSRSNRSGRLYYALRLAYYPRVDRVGPLARGVTITRQYLYRGRPVTAAPVGAVLRVRLTVRSAQDLYYVRVEDPLAAGAEAVDPTLLTTSQLYSGGYRVPPHTSDLAWYVSHVELRDDRAALFAPYLPAGVYRYEYTVQLTTRGVFHALPAHVAETYFPEVFGHGSGGYLTVQ